MLYRATGVPADEYARRVLFEPIGIRSSSWYKGAPNGLPHMGGGLNLRAIDLARLGYLVLRKGQWNGKPVVTEEWVRQSASPVVTPAQFFSRTARYGHLWWLFPLGSIASADPQDWVIAGSGNYGQWLFIVPRHDLVVAVTAGAQNGADMGRPLDLLFSTILPSIR